VAQSVENCEDAVMPALNTWTPAINTACEDRIEVYCQAYALNLAATEVVELQIKLENGSIVRQLWRAVPGFALFGVVAVILYAVVATMWLECRLRSPAKDAAARPMAVREAVLTMTRDLYQALSLVCRRGRHGKIVNFVAAKYEEHGPTETKNDEKKSSLKAERRDIPETDILVPVSHIPDNHEEDIRSEVPLSQLDNTKEVSGGAPVGQAFSWNAEVHSADGSTQDIDSPREKAEKIRTAVKILNAPRLWR
jgi:hypothetical protein